MIEKENLDRFVEQCSMWNMQRPHMDKRATLRAADGWDMTEEEFCVLVLYLGGESPQTILEMHRDGFKPQLIYKWGQYQLNMDIDYAGTPCVSYPAQIHSWKEDFESWITTSI